MQTAGLSLHAELAIDYFELRAADAQQKLLDDTVTAYAEALRVTQNRVDGGAAPESDAAQAQTQLQHHRVQATDIAVQRAQFEHAIAVLIGKPPAAFSLAPAPLAIAPPVIPPACPRNCWSAGPISPPPSAGSRKRMSRSASPRRAYYPSLIFDAQSGFEGHSSRDLVQLAEPVLGGRPVDGRNAVRRRPAPRRSRIKRAPLMTRRSRIIARPR